MIFKALIQGFLTCWRGLTWWVVWWEPTPQRNTDVRPGEVIWCKDADEVRRLGEEIARKQDSLKMEVDLRLQEMRLADRESDIIYNISPTGLPLPSYPGGLPRSALESNYMANQSWLAQQQAGKPWPQQQHILGSSVGAGLGAAAFAAFGLGR